MQCDGKTKADEWWSRNLHKKIRLRDGQEEEEHVSEHRSAYAKLQRGKSLRRNLDQRIQRVMVGICSGARAGLRNG
jgi:hypothetical protein